MKRFGPCLLLAAILSVSVASSAGASSQGNVLCVGGTHCYPSIQAAVDASHDGDTVVVNPGTYAGGIVITDSVSLVGQAAAVTRIAGGGPVLTIGSSSTTPTVTLTGLTITGGDTTTDPQSPHCGPDVPTCGPGYASATGLGGGIEAFPGTTVTIRRSVITGNRAHPATFVPSVKAVCSTGPCHASFGDAAGIDDWGTMSIVDTSVTNNQAFGDQSNGGGIAVESNASLTLERAVVSGNSASAAPPTGRFAQGGGINVDPNGSLTVDASTIDDNEASVTNSYAHPFPEQDGGTDQAHALGGGVFIADGALPTTITNSTLAGNSAVADSPLGEPFAADAALCACGAAPLTLANSVVRDNSVTVQAFSSADTGPSGPGAIEADWDATISNSWIADNSITSTTATGDAAVLGAVGFFFGGTVAPTISASFVVGNTATASAPNGAATVQGGGIVNNGPLTLRHTLVSGNVGTAHGATGFAQGGGIWNGLLFGGPTSPLALQGSIVIGNRLIVGPGLSAQGGGIYTVGLPAAITGSIVAGNAPDQCDGC